MVEVMVSRADTKLQAYSSRHRNLPTPQRGEGGCSDRLPSGQTVVISFGCACSRSLALWATSPVLQQEMFLPMPSLIEHPPSFAFIVACKKMSTPRRLDI